MKKFLVLLLVVVVVLSGCGSSKPKVTKDSLKFKKEYEAVNGQKVDDKTARTVSIPEDNPMVYKTAKDIVKKIKKEESFIVYFGYADCPWCRSVIESLISTSKEYNIKKIYYVDIKNIRDTVKVTPLVGTETVKAGTDDYYELVDKLTDVLEDYTLEGDEGETVITGLKRIYAPNVVAVVKGKPVAMTKGYHITFTDPYAELTDEDVAFSKMLIGQVFNEVYPKEDDSKGSTCTDKESC